MRVLKIDTGKISTGKTGRLMSLVQKNEQSLFVTTDPSVLYIERYMAKNLLPCKVIGVQSLSALLLDSIQIAHPELINKQEQYIILSNILLREGIITDITSGYVDKMLAFMKECKKERITAAMFADVSKKTRGNISSKFSQFDNIMSKFDAELKQLGYTTKEDLDLLLVQELKAGRTIPFDMVVVDSLDSYSDTLLEIIECLLSSVNSICMSFKVTSPKAYDYDICKNSMDALVRIQDKAVAIKDLRIDLTRTEKDITSTSGIEIIERELFNKDTETVSDSDMITLHEVPFAAKEVDTTVTSIVELISQGYAPDDIVVTSTRIENYVETLKSSLEHHGINHFYYKDGSLSNSMLGKYMRLLFQCISNKSDLSDFVHLIQYEFYGINKHDLDVIHEYFHRFGFDKQKAYENGEIYDESNLEIVKHLIDPILLELEELSSNISKAKDFKSVLILVSTYISNIGFDKYVVALHSKFEKSNNLQEADALLSMWKSHISIMESIAKHAGSLNMDTSILFSLYEKQMENASITVGQQYYGQVSILDINQAQYKKSKILFVLGCNEGVFPLPNPTPFVSDYERNIFNTATGSSLRKLVDYNIEKLSTIYSVLTLPSEKLFISWFMNDNDNRAIKPSNVIKNVIKTFSNDRLFRLSEGSRDDQYLSLLNDVSFCIDNNVELDGVVDRYNEFLSDPEYSIRLVEAMKSKNDKSFIGSSRITSAYNENRFISVTRLEKFNGCPFKHFVEYGLKPNRIKLFDETKADMGNFYHQCMEDILDHVKMNAIDVKSMSKSSFHDMISPIIDRVSESHNENIFQSHEKFLFDSYKMKECVKISAWYAVIQLSKGLFDTTHGEYKIGKDIPSLITLDDGTEITLTGIVDRIDTYDGDKVRIIDYKSGAVKFSMDLLNEGIQLQLPLYSFALSSSSNVVGMYYMRIHNPILSSDKVEKIEDYFTMSGPTLNSTDIIEATDSSLSEPSTTSNVVKVSTLKSGALSSRAAVLNESDMEKLMSDAVDIAKVSAEKMLSGDTKAYPFIDKGISACDYCNYKQLCYFKNNKPGCSRKIKKEL